MPNTHICIDSSVFIRGILSQDDVILRIIEQIGDELGLSIPRLVAADAFIGAFAEWQNVDYLLSDNRHFLRDLKTTAYRVVNPDEFVTQL